MHPKFEKKWRNTNWTYTKYSFECLKIEIKVSPQIRSRIEFVNTAPCTAIGSPFGIFDMNLEQIPSWIEIMNIRFFQIIRIKGSSWNTYLDIELPYTECCLTELVVIGINWNKRFRFKSIGKNERDTLPMVSWQRSAPSTGWCWCPSYQLKVKWSWQPRGRKPLAKFVEQKIFRFWPHLNANHLRLVVVCLEVQIASAFQYEMDECNWLKITIDCENGRWYDTDSCKL